MLKSYLKAAFRNIVRNKLYAGVSIAGLSLGLAVCLLAVRYVLYEYSFDKVRDSDRIYEVLFRHKLWNGVQDISSTPIHLDKVLARNFPQIESAAYFSIVPLTVRNGGNPAERVDICEANPSTMKMFGFKLLQGSPSVCLSGLHSIVLTKKAAERIFGTMAVMGKTIRIETDFNVWPEFTVTGVMRDPPSASSLSFTAMIPVQLDADEAGSSSMSWHTLMGCCFIKVNPGVSIRHLTSLLPGLVNSTGGDTNSVSLKLMPLKEVHFATRVQTRLKTYDPEYLYIFSGIALLILAVSLFNFIGINATVLSGRSREVGIRKVIGASRHNLVVQLLVENFLLIASALLGAICLSEILLPLSNSILGVNLKLDYFSGDISLLLRLILVVAVLVLSAVYLSYFISSVDAHSLIQRNVMKPASSGVLRRWLILLQFAVATFLIAVTFIGLRQLYYISHRDLGFDKSDVIVIDKSSVGIGNRSGILKHELEQDPDILSVTVSNWFPSLNYEPPIDAYPVGRPQDKSMLNVAWADEDLVRTLDLHLASGRNFNPLLATDSNAVILNETAARQLGYSGEITIGMRPVPDGVQFMDNNVKVIGVVKDFNFQSLRDNVKPFAIQFVRDSWPMIGIKYRKGDANRVVAFIRRLWKRSNSDHVVQYQFLDNAIDKDYLSDGRMFKAFASGSFAAIFIALTGIFALSFLMIERRTKEVAVRKVLGSSTGGIVDLFSRDFLKLIVGANIVAWPFAYFVVHNWMQGFAYRIGIDLLLFPLVGLVMAGLGLLTILAQVLRAARANPVEALRYE